MNIIHEDVAQDMRIILKSPHIEAIPLILALGPFGNSAHQTVNMNLLTGVTGTHGVARLYCKPFCETKELHALVRRRS